MICSFTYNLVTYAYRVDRVQIGPVVTGRQERLISGDMDTDVIDIEFRINVAGVFEQEGAGDKSANQLWLDALSGSEIVFKSDIADTTSYTIVPDIDHVPSFVQTSRGTYLETVELRFISRSVFQPGDSVPVGIASLRPHFQY